MIYFHKNKLCIIFLCVSIAIITSCKPPKKVSNIIKKITKPDAIKIRKYHPNFHSETDDISRIKYKDPNSKYKAIEKIYNNVNNNEKYLSNPKLLVILPKNSHEFSLMYKKDIYSYGIKKDIDGLLSNVNLTEKTYLFKGKTKSNFFKYIENSEDEPLIIFAHSINKGKHIVLPNGTKINTSLVHKRCLDINKTCLVLTCDGDDFSIKGKITALDGLMVWKKSIENTSSNMTVDDLRLLIEFNRAKMVRKKIIYVSFSLAGSSGVTYVITSEYKVLNFKKINIRTSIR